MIVQHRKIFVNKINDFVIIDPVEQISVGTCKRDNFIWELPSKPVTPARLRIATDYFSFCRPQTAYNYSCCLDTCCCGCSKRTAFLFSLPIAWVIRASW